MRPDSEVIQGGDPHEDALPHSTAVSSVSRAALAPESRLRVRVKVPARITVVCRWLAVGWAVLRECDCRLASHHAACRGVALPGARLLLVAEQLDELLHGDGLLVLEGVLLRRQAAAVYQDVGVRCGPPPPPPRQLPPGNRQSAQCSGAAMRGGSRLQPPMQGRAGPIRRGRHRRSGRSSVDALCWCQNHAALDSKHVKWQRNRHRRRRSPCRSQGALRL